MEGKFFKHTIFINSINRVIRHIIEPCDRKKFMLEDKPEYSVTYSKATDLFRVEYYINSDSKFETEANVLKTFRQVCVASKEKEKEVV